MSMPMGQRTESTAFSVTLAEIAASLNAFLIWGVEGLLDWRDYIVQWQVCVLHAKGPVPDLTALA